MIANDSDIPGSGIFPFAIAAATVCSFVWPKTSVLLASSCLIFAWYSVSSFFVFHPVLYILVAIWITSVIEIVLGERLTIWSTKQSSAGLIKPSAAKLDIASIQKHLPVSYDTGWKSVCLRHGCMVWSYTEDTENSTLYAMSTIVAAAPHVVVSSLRQREAEKLQCASFYSVELVSQAGNASAGSDNLYYCRSSLWSGLKDAPQLLLLPKQYTVSRRWCGQYDACPAWFTSQVVSSDSSPAPSFSWKVFLMYPVSSGLTSVILFVAPVASKTSSSLLSKWSAELCQVRDVLTTTPVASFPQHRSDSREAIRSDEVSSTSTSTPDSKPKTEPIAPAGLKEEVHKGDGEASASLLAGESSTPTEVQQAPPVSAEHKEYLDILEAGFSSLWQSCQAKAGEDGWQEVSSSKGVTVMKRAGAPGAQSTLSCVKGSTRINAPIELLMEWISESEHVKKWDDMFDKGTVIEKINEDVRVERLAYKGIWPTSPRDFCTVMGFRTLDNGVTLAASRSVLHPKCKPLPSYVRADCLDGGFAFCPVEGCDNTFDVTYLTRVDLKGSLPQMVVNRVNQDAPLCVAVLRDKIQPLTQAFLQKKLEEERKKARKEQERKERAERLRIEDSNEKQNGVLLEKVNESNSATVPPAAQTDLPVSNGSGISESLCVACKTIANQAAAALLAEVVLTSDIDLHKDGSFGVPVGWTFDSMEQHVSIYHKGHPSADEGIYMGKGVIKQPVPRVWEALRNSQTRFGCDILMSEMKTISCIDEQSSIVSYVLDKGKCLLKTPMDICCVVSERTDCNRHCIVTQSVDFDEWPVKEGFQRALVTASGWCAEPYIHVDGAASRHATMVTFICQLNLNSQVSKELLLFLCRRQTLGIAILRDKLMRKSKA